MNTRVAIRYAKPFVQLAEEKGVLEQVKNDMVLIAETCKASIEFRRLLKNPIVSNLKKTQVIEVLFKSNLNAFTIAFLDLICKKNRVHELEEIALSVIKIYEDKKGILLAEVTTAVSLSSSQRANIVSLIEKSNTGKTVVLSEKIDTSIIGGYILKIADRMIDASVKTKLQKLDISFSTVA